MHNNKVKQSAAAKRPKVRPRPGQRPKRGGGAKICGLVAAAIFPDFISPFLRARTVSVRYARDVLNLIQWQTLAICMEKSRVGFSRSFFFLYSKSLGTSETAVKCGTVGKFCRRKIVAGNDNSHTRTRRQWLADFGLNRILNVLGKLIYRFKSISKLVHLWWGGSAEFAGFFWLSFSWSTWNKSFLSNDGSFFHTFNWIAHI